MIQTILAAIGFLCISGMIGFSFLSSFGVWVHEDEIKALKKRVTDLEGINK